MSETTFSVGDTRTEVLVEDLKRTQLVQYAGASGGMLTMGMTGRILTDWVGDGRLTNYGVRFVNQVWPGDTLTATAEVTAVKEVDGETIAEFSVVTVNQDDVPVVTGTASGRVG